MRGELLSFFLESVAEELQIRLALSHGLGFEALLCSWDVLLNGSAAATAQQEHFTPKSQRGGARGVEGGLCSDTLTPGRPGHFLAGRPQLSHL